MRGISLKVEIRVAARYYRNGDRNAISLQDGIRTPGRKKGTRQREVVSRTRPSTSRV